MTETDVQGTAAYDPPHTEVSSPVRMLTAQDVPDNALSAVHAKSENAT